MGTTPKENDLVLARNNIAGLLSGWNGTNGWSGEVTVLNNERNRVLPYLPDDAITVIEDHLQAARDILNGGSPPAHPADSVKATVDLGYDMLKAYSEYFVLNLDEAY
jgi:hypothetical protein